jgi:hypothetical protein
LKKRKKLWSWRASLSRQFFECESHFKFRAEL